MATQVDNAAGAWQPYVPSADDPWDVGKVAHLYRRAGFGATWKELQEGVRLGLPAAVDRLLDGPPGGGDVSERVLSGCLAEAARDAEDIERLKAWQLYRMLFSDMPLLEKLTLFFQGHFATSNAKVDSVGLLLLQTETLRRHAFGDYEKMLSAICRDGAMLIWLDGAGSNKRRPNENFAREFLELYTLGNGNFTEEDVRAGARAFTGWEKEKVASRKLPQFRFNPAKHDHGVKTFLGATGAWEATDIVRLTLRRPAAAEFLCRRLYRFFVRDDVEPPQALIEPLVNDFRQSGLNVRALLGVTFRSRHFYSRATRRSIA